MLRRQIQSATAFCLIVLLSIGLSAGDRPLPTPNYDLASRWMAGKGRQARLRHERRPAVG